MGRQLRSRLAEVATVHGEAARKVVVERGPRRKDEPFATVVHDLDEQLTGSLAFNS